jgi:Gram-negative bacterial TonB protein C-terminal
MNGSESSQISRVGVKSLVAICVAAALSPIAFAATETVFPKSAKILRVVPPPQCKEWKAPQPDRRTNVAFPEDAKGIKGDAALLVRISANGEYVGVSDYIGSDDAYIKAAEESVKQWTFKPALCNGEPIVSDARVDFEFRREGTITYGSGSGSAIGRK